MAKRWRPTGSHITVITFPSEGRTAAQTSEGSRFQPKPIHCTCCICVSLGGPELFVPPRTLPVQTTSRPPPSQPLLSTDTPHFTESPDRMDSGYKQQVSMMWLHIYLDWTSFSSSGQHDFSSWICSELTGFTLIRSPLVVDQV